MLANCAELGEGCQDCYSGSGDCQDLACWVPSECQGQLLAQVQVGSDNECLQACKDFGTDCAWFTFDSAKGQCQLLADCGTLGDCISCLSGQRQCSRNNSE